MTIVGFLPRRWRPSLVVGRHAEAIAGFAAAAAGRAPATSWMAEASPSRPAEADAAAGFVLTTEPELIELPHRRYTVWRAKPGRHDPALIHFPASFRFSGDGYAAASVAAMANFIG